MRRLICCVLVLTCLAVPAHAIRPVADIYLNFEQSTNGTAITADILNAATIGTGGTWSIPDPEEYYGLALPETFYGTVATAAQTAIRSAVVGGTEYFDTGTRGMSFDLTATVPKGETLCAGAESLCNAGGIKFTYSGDSDKLTIGAALTFSVVGGANVAEWGYYDTILTSGTTDYCVLDIRVEATVYGRAHTHVGTGDPITIDPTVPVWITGHADGANKTCEWKIYNLNTKQLIGTSLLALQNAVTKWNFTSFGHIGHGEHPTTQRNELWDNIMIKVTDAAAAYPMIPWANSPGASIGTGAAAVIGTGASATIE